jgi:hypothetical protein
MPLRSLTLLLLTALSLSAEIGYAQEAELKSTLEAAYKRWSMAVETKNPTAWASAITMYRQVTTRNLIVSQGGAFPKAVFETSISPADTSGLRLLEAQAVGDTAHLLYFGKINVGGDVAEIPDNLLMLKFFRDKGNWKFDSNKIIHLRTRPDLLEKLKQGAAPDFLDLPEFTPPGKAPTVPAICPVPKHISGGTIQSIGYETDVTINGYEYYVRDNVLKVFVIGGLSNGANQISLKAKKLEVPKGSDRALELDLFTKPTKPGANGQRVFHYEYTGSGEPSPSRSSWELNMPVTSELSVTAAE